MSGTAREFWVVGHGWGFGLLFLLAFAGGLAGFYRIRSDVVTPAGVRQWIGRLRVGVVSMAVVAWLTVVTGTWIVYPWYRDPAPDSPRSMLLADPSISTWHTFGMEWKEHVAWLSPILATVAAFIVVYYGVNLIRHDRVRKTAMTLFIMAFVFAGIAGLLGALISNVAPVA